MLGELAAVLTAAGVGGILMKLVDRLLDRRKGRLEQEQTAWERLDAESRYRRLLEECLHDTRRDLHELGVDYDDMPTWPSRGGPPPK